MWLFRKRIGRDFKTPSLRRESSFGLSRTRERMRFRLAPRDIVEVFLWSQKRMQGGRFDGLGSLCVGRAGYCRTESPEADEAATGDC